MIECKNCMPIVGGEEIVPFCEIHGDECPYNDQRDCAEYELPDEVSLEELGEMFEEVL